MEPTLPMIPHLKFVALEVVFKSQEMIFEQKKLLHCDSTYPLDKGTHNEL